MAGSAWKKGVSRAALAVGTAGLLALAGCTATGRSAYDTYGAPNYADGTGADRLYRHSYVRSTRPEAAEMYAVLSRPLDARVAQDFEGIEGARRAHQLFPPAMAEKFDGACEPEVKLQRGETIYDVVSLCDVSLPQVMDVNYRRYRNVRHAGGGDWVTVPQAYNAERAAFMAGYVTNPITPASAYVVQPGDTLNDIAAKHLTSPAAVATLNQSINFQYIRAGDTIWIPSATGTAPAAAAPYAAPPKPGAISGSLPYNYGHAHAGRGDGGNDTIGLMPYQLTPGQKAAENNAPRGLLTISARTVNPGESVTVRGDGLPENADISIYRGANGRDLELVKTVRTNSSGSFEEPFAVTDTDGGVIFQATVSGSDERYQSPRVGVVDRD